MGAMSRWNTGGFFSDVSSEMTASKRSSFSASSIAGRSSTSTWAGTAPAVSSRPRPSEARSRRTSGTPIAPDPPASKILISLQTQSTSGVADHHWWPSRSRTP